MMVALLPLLAAASALFPGLVASADAGPRHGRRQECVPPGNRTDWTWDQIPPSRKLRWYGCFGETNLHCARLDVPMDWQNPTDDKRVVLAVLRRRAANPRSPDYRGPAIVNNGGEGGSGVFYLKTYGAYVQSVIGENYDIYAFDPRGVGASTPRYDCFSSPAVRALFAAADPGIIDAYPSFSLAGHLHSRGRALAALCEKNVAKTGLPEHSGTTYVARDMLEIVNQSGYPDLAYWGFSYGSVIGNLFAAMFPDRVGKIMLDANVDVDEWFGNPDAGRFYLTDAEKVMEAFYTFCHKAGAEKCAYYESSPEAIKAKLDALFARLQKQPIIVEASADPATKGPAIPELITYSALKKLTWGMLYQPYYSWPLFAQILAALEKGDGRPFYEYNNGAGPAVDVCAAKPQSVFEPQVGLVYQTPDAYPFITCADKLISTKNATIEDAVKEAEALLEWTPAGGAVNMDGFFRCTGRTIAPKWRFEGPYSAKTKNPMLYLNNVADPITPLISAQNNAKRFPGAVVLAQESYGHTFLAAPSQCSTEYINAYFQNGTLPAEGTVCAPNGEPFTIQL